MSITLPRLRCLSLFLLAFGCAVPALQAEDGGGRDVTVALFSTHPVSRVTLTPLSANAWTAHCAQCPHKPLIQPLSVAEGREVFAGGTLRVTDDTAHDANAAGRTSTGLWHLRGDPSTHSVDVTLTLPSERYVAYVLNAEAAHDEPQQSLQALAVVARTFALNGKHYTAQRGHLDADLCDSTQCQAMLLQAPSQAVQQATRSTAGETLWFGGHRAEVYFSQNCGGLTEDVEAMWPRLQGLPYLHSHADPYCLRRPSSAWHAQIKLDAFASVADSEGWHLPANLVSAQIAQRSRSHRALRIVFSGRNGATATLGASALRFGIDRALGWNQVRSDSYELGLRNGSLVFDGRGHGHGVGLCQVGAAEMAAEGKSSRDILAFYFPGTAVRITAADQGWQQTRVGPLTVRTTQPLSNERQAMLLQQWSEAQRRFKSARPVTPTLVFAPTTELFRQLTAQPGWALASTQGATIVLQPEAVFRTHNRNESSTLLHEFLHVAVESACNDRTPLWLREGLVEALSGEPVATTQALSVQEIEATLQRADSLQSGEQAHKAAAAKVKALLDRYGLATVRGWLSSGVPPGVS
jgi:stage II sporulation protein D